MIRFKNDNADITALENGDSSHLDIFVPNDIRKEIVKYSKLPALKTVLVLGGNGFVGIHLLHSLIANPSVKRIYAIIRKSPRMSLIDRIQKKLGRYNFNFNSRSKLYLLQGEYTKKHMGLNLTEYKRLCSDVDIVFQVGGSSNHLIPYKSIRKHCIFPLFQLFDFCVTEKIKPFHFLGSALAEIYQNTEDFKRYDWYYCGYSRMKWICKSIIQNINSKGFPACVSITPYVLGSELSDYKDPGKSYSFWRALNYCRRLKMIWEGPCGDIIPADILTNIFVENAFSNNPKTILRPTISSNNKSLAELFGLELVTWEEFYNKLRKKLRLSILAHNFFPNDLPSIIEKTISMPVISGDYLFRKPISAIDVIRRGAEHL